MAVSFGRQGGYDRRRGIYEFSRVGSLSKGSLRNGKQNAGLKDQLKLVMQKKASAVSSLKKRCWK